MVVVAVICLSGTPRRGIRSKTWCTLVFVPVADNVAHLLHRTQPLVVKSFEVRVFLYSHDGGIGQRRLVQIVQTIDDAHDLQR